MPKTQFRDGLITTPQFWTAINNPVYKKIPDNDGEIPYPDLEGLGVNDALDTVAASGKAYSDELATAIRSELHDLVKWKFTDISAKMKVTLHHFDVAEGGPLSPDCVIKILKHYDGRYSFYAKINTVQAPAVWTNGGIVKIIIEPVSTADIPDAWSEFIASFSSLVICGPILYSISSLKPVVFTHTMLDAIFFPHTIQLIPREADGTPAGWDDLLYPGAAPEPLFFRYDSFDPSPLNP